MGGWIQFSITTESVLFISTHTVSDSKEYMRETKRTKALDGGNFQWFTSTTKSKTKHISSAVVQQKHVRMICLSATVYANYICTAMELKLNLHTIVKLKVGAAGVPATHGNEEANPWYQNTFTAVLPLVTLVYDKYLRSLHTARLANNK